MPKTRHVRIATTRRVSSVEQFLGLTSKLVATLPGPGNLSTFATGRLSVPLALRREAANRAETLCATTIARGSALECAAVLDALEAMTVFSQADLNQARELLERVVSMLRVSSDRRFVQEHDSDYVSVYVRVQVQGHVHVHANVRETWGIGGGDSSPS